MVLVWMRLTEVFSLRSIILSIKREPAGPDWTEIHLSLIFFTNILVLHTLIIIIRADVITFLFFQLVLN